MFGGGSTNVGTIEWDARINTSKLAGDLALTKGGLGSVGDSAESAGAKGTSAMAKFAKAGVLVAAAAVTALAVAIGKQIPAAIDRIDTLVAFPRVMKALGISSDEAKVSINKLSKELTGLPTPLDEGARGVQRLVTSGLKIDKATDAFLGLNNALLVGGAGTAQVESAFLQLSQAISRGKMEGAEWNNLASNMPTVMQALQNETGKTKDELREMFMEDPQGLIDNIIRLNKEGGGGLASLNDQAREATGGIKTSMALVGTSIARGITEVVEALGNGDLEKGQEKLAAPFKNGAKFFDEFFNKIVVGIEWFKNTFWPSIEPTVDGLVNLFAPALKAIGNEFKKLIDDVKKLVTENEPLVQYFKLFAQVIGGILLGAIVVIGLAILVLIVVFRFWVKVVSDTWNAIGILVGWFMDAYNKIKDAVTGFGRNFEILRAIVSETFDRMIERVKSAMSSIWSTMVEVANSIIGFYAGAWSWLINAGRNIIQGLANGISGMGGAIWDAISSAASSIGNFFAEAGSWLFSAGQSIIRGLVDGIESMIGQVQSTLSSITDKIPDWKGPANKDKILLVHNAELIMGGFISGLEGQFGAVKSTLGGLTADIPVMANNGFRGLENGSSVNNNSNVSINLNMSGVMSRSANDEREIARNLLKRLNQELTAKGQPAIGGII